MSSDKTLRCQKFVSIVGRVCILEPDHAGDCKRPLPLSLGPPIFIQDPENFFTDIGMSACFEAWRKMTVGRNEAEITELESVAALFYTDHCEAPTIDGLTNAECLERFTMQQREDRHDETTFLTAPQMQVAREAWTAQLRRRT